MVMNRGRQAIGGESETEGKRSAAGDGSRRKALRFHALRLLTRLCVAVKGRPG